MLHSHSPVNSKGLIAYARANPVFRDALDFAQKSYKKIRRPLDNQPFSVHPMVTCSVLLEFDGIPEAAMAAAALEDIKVKGRLSDAEIEKRFGAEVAGYVRVLSPATGEDYLAGLSAANASVQTVKMASILEYLSTIPARKKKDAGPLIAQCAAEYKALPLARAELARRTRLQLERFGQEV